MSSAHSSYMNDLYSVDYQINQCNNNKRHSKEKMLNHLYQKYPRSLGELRVHNQHLLKNPRYGLLDLYKSLVTYETKEGELNWTEGIFKNQKYKKCDTILCLTDHIFGKGLGVYYLYFLDKFHFNLSHLSNPESFSKKRSKMYSFLVKFTENELIKILTALSMFKTGALKNIEFGYHLKKSDHYNGKTIANASINLFKTWSELKGREQIQTIIHELGHVYADIVFKKPLSAYENIGLDSSDSWLNLSNWKIDPEQSRLIAIYDAQRDKTQKNFVSWYAKKNPAEDFAESFTSYILNPYYLKSKALRKYQFLKKHVFGNYSYDKSQCISSHDGLFSRADLIKIDQKKVSDVANNCFLQFVKAINTRNNENLNRCIVKQIRGNHFLPLIFGPKEIENEIGKTGKQTIIFKQLASKTINLMTLPEACTDNYTPLIDPMVSLNGETVYRPEIRYLSKRICRWSKSVLRTRMLPIDLENIKAVAYEILLSILNDLST